MTEDLVKRAREALEGVTEGPWAIDEGGEVHKDGRVIYAWPKWNGADFDEQTERNMAFGVAARTLVPSMADRIEELETKLKWVLEERDTLAELTGGKDE